MKNIIWNPPLRARQSWTCSAVLFGLLLLPAVAKDTLEPGFPADIRLPEQARGEAAIAALGNRLPEVAAFHGKSPQRLRKIFQTDNSLWVNPEGRLFYTC